MASLCQDGHQASTDFQLLLDLAKVRYKDDMDQFVSSNENTGAGFNLIEYHKRAVHTALELSSETMPLTTSQKNEMKQELDHLLKLYQTTSPDNSVPALNTILIKNAKIQYKKLMDDFTIKPTYIEEHILLRHHQDSATKVLETVSKVRHLHNHHKQIIMQNLAESFLHYKEINDKKKESKAPAIGIDLGTTFCYVAVCRNINTKTPKIIQSETGKNYTPSYIAFPKEEDNDEDISSDDEYENNAPICGTTAKDLAHENLKFTIFDVKRMLGKKITDPSLQKDMLYWPFDVVDDEDQIKVKTGNDSYHTPVELTAMLLQHLKSLADKYLNSNVISAVLAVPAYFNANQRHLILEAARKANINVLQLVTEPTAAAVAYSIHKRSNSDKSQKNCLIFDFGGGTLDVAVLSVNSNHIQVKSVKGDPHLGGQDIDNNMVDYCLEEFKKKHGVDILQEKIKASPEEQMKICKRLRRLKLECETRKRFLSQSNEQTISLESMHKGVDLVVRISRRSFNSMNDELFKRSIDVMKQALEDSKLGTNDIDEVVLVGGSCRIPRLKEMVSEFFGGKPLCMSVDTDEAVAIGAAMLAFYAENVEIPNVLIQNEKEDLIAQQEAEETARVEAVENERKVALEKALEALRIHDRRN